MSPCPDGRFGAAECGQGLVNSSVDIGGVFPVDKDGLINLTVSLITAEIVGLCQRSGPFSNGGQVPRELETPSNIAGESPLRRLPVL